MAGGERGDGGFFFQPTLLADVPNEANIMLDSLDLCSAGDQEIHDHIEPLTQWFDVRLPAVVRTRGGQPLAWEVHGTRL